MASMIGPIEAKRVVMDAMGWHRYDAELGVSPDGWAVLALACNALAKREEAFYLYKGALVAEATANGRDEGDWWADSHADSHVILIETKIILPEREYAQMAFHFPNPDNWARSVLDRAPAARGRRWRRQILSDRVAEVLEAYLKGV